MYTTDSHKSMTFKDDTLGTLLRPRQTFERLLTDEGRLKFGFYAILLTMAGGVPSSFEPWQALWIDTKSVIVYQGVFLVFNW